MTRWLLLHHREDVLGVREGPSPGPQGWDGAFPRDDGWWVLFAESQSQGWYEGALPPPQGPCVTT